MYFVNKFWLDTPFSGFFFGGGELTVNILTKNRCDISHFTKFTINARKK